MALSKTKRVRRLVSESDRSIRTDDEWTMEIERKVKHSPCWVSEIE